MILCTFSFFFFFFNDTATTEIYTLSLHDALPILKRLINDLLDMSAILTGKMRMEELPVSLGDVVSEAVETVRPLAVAGDIQLHVTFHDWQNEMVSGDRARLLQVFWNLLSNAIKFSSAGGRVKVECLANVR